MSNCDECSSSEIITDDANGQFLRVCTNCGTVQSTYTLVNELNQASTYRTNHLDEEKITKHMLEILKKAETYGRRCCLNSSAIERLKNIIMDHPDVKKRRKSKFHILAACLLKVCRENDTCTSIIDVSKVTGVDSNLIFKEYNKLNHDCKIITIDDECDRFLQSTKFDSNVKSTTKILVKLSQKTWIIDGKLYKDLFIALCTYEAWRCYNRSESLKKDDFNLFMQEYLPNLMDKFTKTIIQKYKNSIRQILQKMLKKIKPNENIKDKFLFLHLAEILENQKYAMGQIKSYSNQFELEQIERKSLKRPVNYFGNVEDLENHLEESRQKRIQDGIKRRKEMKEFKNKHYGVLPLSMAKAMRSYDDDEVSLEIKEEEIDSYIS